MSPEFLQNITFLLIGMLCGASMQAMAKAVYDFRTNKELQRFLIQELEEEKNKARQLDREEE